MIVLKEGPFFRSHRVPSVKAVNNLLLEKGKLEAVPAGEYAANKVALTMPARSSRLRRERDIANPACALRMSRRGSIVPSTTGRCSPGYWCEWYAVRD